MFNMWDTIESKSIHDLVSCKCDSCYVDGGQDYLLFGGKSFDKILILFDDGAEIVASDEKIIKRNRRIGRK